MRTILLVLTLGACAATAPRADTATTLRVQTQALLDAIFPGHAEVWKDLLDPDIVYVAEDGSLETRASLVEGLKPFPAGIKGSIKMSRFDVHQDGDTAVVVHDDDETEDFFGHPVSAVYRTVDTWRRRPEGWRLVASQVHAQNADPAEISLAPAELDAYVGSYRLTPEISYTIRRDGAKLVGERSGGKAAELHVEVRDVLFVPGSPRSRKIFARDAGGQVMGFVDRREGRDIAWSKVR